MPGSSSKKPASSSKKPDPSQAKESIQVVRTFAVDEALTVNAQDPLPYSDEAAPRPRAFEKCNTSSSQSLTCVRLQGRRRRAVLTRDQCNGHKGNHVNMYACRHKSLVRRKLCGHVRCDDCTIRFQGRQYLDSKVVLDEAYPVGGYPGARALEAKMGNNWAVTDNSLDRQ